MLVHPDARIVPTSLLLHKMGPPEDVGDVDFYALDDGSVVPVNFVRIFCREHPCCIHPQIEAGGMDKTQPWHRSHWTKQQVTFSVMLKVVEKTDEQEREARGTSQAEMPGCGTLGRQPLGPGGRQMAFEVDPEWGEDNIIMFEGFWSMMRAETRRVNGSSDGFRRSDTEVQGMVVPSQPILDITSDQNDDLRRAILADSVRSCAGPNAWGTWRSCFSCRSRW